jgi:hypothetical protein
MVQDPGNGYCNSGVPPPNKGTAEFFAKDFLMHGNKVMNLINHLVVQVTSQFGCDFCPGQKLIR